MAINYKFLSPEEFSLLQPSMNTFGGDVPDTSTSIVAGAFSDSNELVGYAVLQSVPHLEPVWIDEKFRAKVNWRNFQEMIEGLFDREQGGAYYALASDPKTDHPLCDGDRHQRNRDGNGEGAQTIQSEY